MKTSSSSSSVTNHDDDHVLAALINDVSSKMDKSTKIISFPGYSQKIPSRGYELFFGQLQKKLSQFEIYLNRLVLLAGTNDAIGGLIAYCQLAAVFDVKAIEIHMDETLDISLIQTLLSKLNDYHLMDIIFIDKENRFSLEEWTAVSEIISRDAISFSITLPDAFYQQPIQRLIDENTSNNRFLNNQARLTDEKKTNLAGLFHSMPKRSRPQITNHQQHLVTDIDLQQDIQVNTAIEQQKDCEDSYVSDYDIKGLTLQDIAVALCEQKIPLNSGAELLTTQVLRNLWNIWAGDVIVDGKCYSNCRYQTISMAAAQQLLNYRHLFEAGLNTDSLPEGFILVADKPSSSSSSPEYILHYDDNLLQDDEIITPVLIEKPSLSPLPHALCDALITKKNDSWIALKWEAMKNGAYSRKDVDAFRQYLPILLELTDTELNQVFAFASNGQLLSYIMDNYQQIATIFQTKTIEEVEQEGNIITYILLKKLSKRDLINQLIRASQALATRQPSDNSLLLLLAEQHPLLHQQAMAWSQKLQFDSQQIHAMMQVYCEYGDKGLDKLFALWEKIDASDSEALTHLHNTLFKTAKTFAPMMQDEKIAQAIQAILAFTKLDEAQGIWWSVLLEQHAKAAGYDYLPALVDAFVLFTKQITQRGLTFYPEVDFASVKNMPTVLNRIITLLNQCYEDDLDIQWRCITHLDWQSNGAIRALIDSKTLEGNPYRFITPAMDIRPDYYYLPKKFFVAKGYLPCSDLHWIIEPQKQASQRDSKAFKFIWNELWGRDNDFDDNLTMVRQHYYRYIAAEKHRYPLAFYLAIDEAIKKTTFTRIVQANLYAAIVSTTTGEINGQHSGNLEEDIKTGQDFLDKWAILSLPLPFLRPIYRSRFSHALPDTPLFDYQQRLLLLEHTLKIEHINPITIREEFNKKHQRLDDSFLLDAQIENRYHNAYSKSIRFYTNEVLASQIGVSLYYKHMNVLLVFIQHVPEIIKHLNLFGNDTLDIPQDKDTPNDKKLPDKNIEQLISLVSLFSLASNEPEQNKQIANTIYQLVLDALKNGEAITTGLEFLTAIKKQDAKILTHKELINFIKEFTRKKTSQLDDQAIQCIVEKHFKSSFASNFFDNLTAKRLQADVCDYLEGKFPDIADRRAIEKVLIAFPKPCDSLSYLDMCKKIYAMTRDLSSADRQSLCQKLSNPLLIANLGAKDFLTYLEPIKTNADVSECFYIIHKAETMSVAANSHLLPKIHLYLKTLWPEINPLLSATIPKVELRNMVINLLFALESLTVDEYHVINADDYDRLIEVLNVSCDDSALLWALDDFMKIAPLERYPALQQLRNGLSLNTSSSSSSDVTWGNSWQIFQQNRVAIIHSARHELTVAKRRNHSCDQLFIDVFKTIHLLVERYKNDKLLLIKYLNYFLTHHDKSVSQLIFAVESIGLITKEYLALDNNDGVRSLCLHFSKQSGDYTPMSLLRLFQNTHYETLSLANKKIVLNVLTLLLDTHKQVTLNDFEQLLSYCCQESTSQASIDAISRCYQTAPFPELSRLLLWLQDCPSDAEPANYLDVCYSQFDKAPCARDSRNGFEIFKASSQAFNIQGTEYNWQELLLIESEVQQVRELATKDISCELNALRQGQLDITNERLLALTAELLYRTKGRDSNGSFEINTTQYLAIHSMLKAGSHVTSEIGTGEGKSRIMMLMIACQYARGKTIDFVTSNMPLATRDYLAFRAFFQALGAKTILIHQHTLANDYALDGINFSDAANINLFRNKAYSEGNHDLVIHPIAAKRALMLDEADRTFFDLADTRFNYSAMADGVIRDMPWVYDLLVSFFSQPKPDIMTLYHTDIDACTELFMGYAKTQLNKTQYKRLSAVSSAQLEAWQQSAVIALGLKIDEHFTIKTPIDIQTNEGPKQVSDAWLLVGKRQDSHSRYSFGVHQCLHARLNLLKHRQHTNTISKVDLAIKSYLTACDNDFFIDNEKQIIYSSSSKSMLDEYQSGVLVAVTGTAGSIREQEEVKGWYGQGDALPNMIFLSVPRHLGLNRKDYPIYLTANKQKQYQQIVQHVMNAQVLEQPCVIICEHDHASKKMLKYLIKALPDNAKKHLKRISANTHPDIEADYIEHSAGKPGSIIVSTDMIGRGTDIVLHGNATNHGLRVLVAYLPSSLRGSQQILGRAGRLGAAGDTRLILNKKRVKKQLGKTSLNDGFYTATEAYIQHQQELLAHTSQIVRTIQYSVETFKCQLTRRYYNGLFTQKADIDREKFYASWQHYVDETDKKWLEIWPMIHAEIMNAKPDFVKINQMLLQYQGIVQEKWNILIHTSLALIIPAEELQSLKQVGELQLTAEQIQFLQGVDSAAKPRLKTPVYEKYDAAHDGKAALYKRSFEQTRAFFKGERPLFANLRAWWNGRGILFPNLRAFLQGAISFRELVFGANTSANQPISPANCSIKIATSYALMTETGISHDNDISNRLDNQPVHMPFPLTQIPVSENKHSKLDGSLASRSPVLE